MNETYRTTVQYAVAIAGSERRLAERLGVSARQVSAWAAGIEEVPAEAFQRAIDVVIGATAEEMHRSRSRLIRPSAHA